MQFLWRQGWLYRDRTDVIYLCEGEHVDGGLSFVALNPGGPVWCQRRGDGRCVQGKDGEGDILPSHIREYGTAEDRQYMEDWGYGEV